MNIPKHVNPGGKNRVARAPYNFVPLPEEILTVEPPPTHDRYHKDLLSGRLECTLTTLSPLFVRAAQTLDQFRADPPKPPEDHFYGETESDLRIPGSSLRGMLRTLVEIVSQSRIKPVTDYQLFYRTFDGSSIGDHYAEKMVGRRREDGTSAKAQAGYMEWHKGEMVIRPALRLPLGADQTGQFYQVQINLARNKVRNYSNWIRKEIYFQPPADPEADVTQIEDTGAIPSGTGWQKGWLVASGLVGPRKKRQWIINPPDTDDSKLIDISDEDIELYRGHVVNQGGITKKNKCLSVLPENGSSESIPCFYHQWVDVDGQDRVAFGHTAMFRMPYIYSPREMLPDYEDDQTQYDLAEAVFGFVDQRQEGHRDDLAGRIFISDAIFQGDPEEALMDPFEISDQALSSPKPTAVQHYLTQDIPDSVKTLRHYDDRKDETTLRGHKNYWHYGKETEVSNKLQESEPRERHSGNRFRPVRAGQTFSFSIHFENLRSEELGAILWVLDICKAPEYSLKLGMGKPYGMGSVRLNYDPLLVGREQRYQSLFQDDHWAEGFFNNEQQEEVLLDTRRAFNHFITGKDDGHVDKLSRIQELLTLLNWNHKPDWQMIRYMTLKEFIGDSRDRRNNPLGLDRRPVLPEASKVVDREWFNHLPAKAPEPMNPVGQTAMGAWWDDYTRSKEETDQWPPEVGMKINGTVDAFDDNGDVWFVFPRSDEEGVFGRVKAAKLSNPAIKEGETVSLKVLEILDEYGETIVECELSS